MSDLPLSGDQIALRTGESENENCINITIEDDVSAIKRKGFCGNIFPPTRKTVCLVFISVFAGGTFTLGTAAVVYCHHIQHIMSNVSLPLFPILNIECTLIKCTVR